jgi:hypothetical protein
MNACAKATKKNGLAETCAKTARVSSNWLLINGEFEEPCSRLGAVLRLATLPHVDCFRRGASLLVV